MCLQAGHVGGVASVTGSISVNGEVVTPDRMRLISGFVHQEDVILDTMTVRSEVDQELRQIITHMPVQTCRKGYVHSMETLTCLFACVYVLSLSMTFSRA